MGGGIGPQFDVVLLPKTPFVDRLEELANADSEAGRCVFRFEQDLILYMIA